MRETEHKTAEQIEASHTSGSFISATLPSIIRGLYRADLREKSVQNILDLAADLVQELIDNRAAGVTPTPSVGEWIAAMDAERARQVEHVYDDAHDDEHGPAHLLLWAIEHARRGRNLAAATLAREAKRRIEASCDPTPSPDREKLIAEAERWPHPDPAHLTQPASTPKDLIDRLRAALASPVEVDERKILDVVMAQLDEFVATASPVRPVTHAAFGITRAVAELLQGCRDE